MPEKNDKSGAKKKARKAESSLGYLPDVYKGFVQQYPGISKAIDAVAETCQAAGPLDKKTAELIKLGFAIGINSEGAIRSHTRRAIAEGISPAEIRHVVLLAFTTC
jgi:4-carboxymuconolactone decarboxylase